MKKELKNDYGKIPVGTEVWFEVENMNMWGGDIKGILKFKNGEFVIETKKSGTITIGKGYDAYFNTIHPV